MSNTDTARSGGMGFFSVLGLIFIVLKLTSIINWSWWWVLMPLYGPLVLLGFLIGVVFLIDCCGKDDK